MIHPRRLIGVLGAAALAGCTMQTAGTPARTVAPLPPASLQATAPSPTSAALAAYYKATEDQLLAQGLLRTDGGGADTPITARSLAANFERIALYDEYTVSGGRFVAQQSESRLRRWSTPVRLRPVFGAGVPAAQRARDMRDLTAYVARLSRLTGLPITVTDKDANYHVLFMTADEQSAAGPLLRQLVPGIGTATVRDITSMQRYTFCSVYAFSDRARPYSYVAAVAVIKAEHPDLLRLSCIHEELAQGLGLANDSPVARPSIFNDDEEFALLTRHDEILLQMLYDRRLRVGMSAAEARPIIARIAAEKVGGGA